MTSYVKRTDSTIWLVLNLPKSRWQVQNTSDKTQTECYAYCEQSYVQPERCSGHLWMVDREGSFDEHGDMLVTTTPSKSQLAVIDKEDRVARLITSNKKMTTIEEVCGVMGLVAYSNENMNNVPLVLKACTCLINVLRSKNNTINAGKIAMAFGVSTIDISAEVVTSLSNNGATQNLLLTNGNGQKAAYAADRVTKIDLVKLLCELLNIHLSFSAACEAILRCVRYLCRW